MEKKSPDSRWEEGLLLVDKPEGPTSHDVVRQVRRALGIRRVGHTGTLDPFASGLLLLCVGRATRLAEYFHLLPKTYRGVAVLGERTDTDDRTGCVLETSDAWAVVTLDDVRTAASRLEGEHEQRPPAYSAKRVGGRRAYEAARAGETVNLEPVAVSVHRFTVTGLVGSDIAFEAEVSTGTYIRALARDLGEELGCPAHLASLRRTSVGPFHVDGAVPSTEHLPESISSVSWRSPAEALSWLPNHQLADAEVARIQFGQAIVNPDPEAGSDSLVALLGGERLVAVARAVAGELRPEKVFFEE